MKMSVGTLTAEQKAFLEECALEFSERFSDADVEYKKTYDSGIPVPPIMDSWYGRNRSIPNRSRAGGSHYTDRDRYENNSSRNYDGRSRDQSYSDRGERRDYHNHTDTQYSRRRPY